MKMNLSLKARILSPVLVTTLLMLATSLVGFKVIHSRVTQMTEKGQASVQNNRQIAMIERQFGIMIQDWKNTLLRGKNSESRAKHSAGMDEAIEKQKKISAELMDRLGGEEKEHLSQFVANLTELEKKYKAARQEFINDTAFQPAEADQAVKGIDRKALDPLKQLVEVANKHFEASQEEAVSQLRNSIILCAAFLSALVAIAVLAIFRVIGGIAGYLTTLIGQLFEIADELRASSATMKDTSGKLSRATTEQAASLEQTASSLEEIGSMITKTSQGSSDSEAGAVQSLEKAEEGRKAVNQMLLSMEDISRSNEAIVSQIHRSNNEMAEIIKVIQEIGSKTKVINDIVFQTKLLSFNASVEAARAGEHGKGFAVVAEEVGNLAAMSGNSAKEIGDMLESSIAKVETMILNTKNQVSTLVEGGKSKVEAGVAVAHECSTLLGEIVQNVSKVSGFAREITSASQEQSQGMGEINKAMSQLDSCTQENAATSEEAAQLADQLSARADQLKQSVNSLLATVLGAQAAPAEAAVAELPRGRRSEGKEASRKAA